MSILKITSALFLAFIGIMLMGSAVVPASYNLVQSSGTPLTRRSTLNCLGSLTCADDGVNKVTTLTGGAVPGNYTQSFTSQTSVALAHNFNTNNVLTQCYDGSNVQVIPNTTTNTSVNTVTVTFSIAQTGYCNVNGAGSTGTGGVAPSYHYQYFTIVAGNGIAGTLAQLNTGAALAQSGLNAPGGGFNSIGVAEFAQAGTQGILVTRLPSSWDSTSNITLDIDTFVDTGSGSASLTPYGSCVTVGGTLNTTTWHAGTNVPIVNPGGTTPYVAYALTVPTTGCAGGNMMYIGIVRPNTDSFTGFIYLMGANVGIRY